MAENDCSDIGQRWVDEDPLDCIANKWISDRLQQDLVYSFFSDLDASTKRVLHTPIPLLPIANLSSPFLSSTFLYLFSLFSSFSKTETRTYTRSSAIRHDVHGFY